jgi:DNA-binding transcriptional ArsR family regulator
MSHSATDPGTGNEPQYFTADEVAARIKEAEKAALERARTEERDKLYGKIRQTDERYQTMEQELKALREAEAARAKEEQKRQAEIEKARKAKEDAEKSAKELLAERESEWQRQLTEMQKAQEAKMAEIAQQQQLQQAMWEKEREMAALQIYIRDRLAAEQDNIAPELIDFVDGTTKEEVDASIERVKLKTAQIVEGLRQAASAQRAGMPGVAPAGGATAITPGLDTGDQKLTADDIRGMSMKDFAALRAKVGMGSGGGSGLFG